MGLDLVSCGRNVHISYSGWNVVRCAIVRATIAYAEALQAADRQESEHLQSWVKEIDAAVDDKLVGAVVTSAAAIGTRDMLNLHGLAGVIALCERYDCQGAYSPGQALDILLLLQLVTPYVGVRLGSCETIFHEEIVPLFQLAVERRNAIMLF